MCGEPVCNNITFLSSRISLFEPFRGVSHGRLEGSNATKLAQVWPRVMCQRICTGTLPFIRQLRGSGGSYLHISDRHLPADGVAFGRFPRGRPHKNPKGVISKEAFIQLISTLDSRIRTLQRAACSHMGSSMWDGCVQWCELEYRSRGG